MGKKNTIEFMKIRQYVMDLIATGGDQPRKIPSSRKLGEMFGVTHPTVLRAIQSLSEDGFLIACRGGGSITCPGRFDMKQMKIFAVLTTSGKVAFDIYYHNLVLLSLTRELTRRSGDYCTQNIYLNSLDDLTRVMAEHPYAGLLLVGVQEPALLAQLTELHRQNIRMAAFLDEIPGVPGMILDYDNFYTLALEELIRHGKHAFYIPLLPDMPEKAALLRAIDAVRAAHPDKPFSVEFPEETMDVHAQMLEERLKRAEKIDGIVCIRRFDRLYRLREHDAEFARNALFIGLEFSIYDDMHFTGCVISPELDDAAKRLLDHFLASGEQPMRECIKLAISFRRDGVKQ